MKTFFKILIFFALFTLAFFWLRLSGVSFYNASALIMDLGGLTYLYSTVGVIFAIFSAFVILSQVERWNNLTDAVKKETSALKELYFWSQHIPDEKLEERFVEHIKKYLTIIIEKAFEKSKKGKRDSDIDEAIMLLHSDIYDVQIVNPGLMPIGFPIFTDLLKAHDERIHYASMNLPSVLKYTLYFNNVVLVLLSMMIGVHNVMLDYVFLISITILCYINYIVVNDLNNPLQSGSWHVTVKDYQEVLDYIK